MAKAILVDGNPDVIQAAAPADAEAGEIIVVGNQPRIASHQTTAGKLATYYVAGGVFETTLGSGRTATAGTTLKATAAAGVGQTGVVIGVTHSVAGSTVRFGLSPDGAAA